MSPLLFRIRAWWEAADRSQRVITIGGSLFMGMLLLGTFYFASRPKFTALYTGMNEIDKSSVVAAIVALNCPVNYDVPGEVDVPENRREEMNFKLSGAGKAPKSGHLGIEGIDKIGLATTPAVERERLKNVLQDEVAVSIETLESVESAKVLVTLGDPSPLFVEQRKPPTASVVVTERTGKQVTVDQARAIAATVARAVDGLDSQDITVVNQRFEMLFNGKDADSAKSQAQTKLDLEEQVAGRKQRQLQQVFDNAFGVGSTIVTVHCGVDLNEQTQKSTSQKPSTDPVQKLKSSEEYTGDTGALPGGIAGAAPNTSPSVKDSGATKKGFKSTSLTEGHLINETITDEKKATGSLTSMVINVMANKTRITDLDALKQRLAGEVLGYSDETTKFTTTVTSTAFDTTTAKDATAASAASAGQARTQQIMSMLPIAAMLIVAVMVVRQIGKLGGNAPAAVASLNGAALSLPINLAGLSPAEQTAARSLLASIEAEAGDSNGIVPHPRSAIAMGSGPDDDPVIVNSIKDRVHVPLEQLKKMAKERPATVATLVKSMLLEENR